uniref:Uncharacterized protein n=1 Tax=Rhizophora mucronata TaxID=61149 RepID=A0A2P2N4N7_RHIMU
MDYCPWLLLCICICDIYVLQGLCFPASDWNLILAS